MRRRGNSPFPAATQTGNKMTMTSSSRAAGYITIILLNLSLSKSLPFWDLSRRLVDGQCLIDFRRKKTLGEWDPLEAWQLFCIEKICRVAKNEEFCPVCTIHWHVSGPRAARGDRTKHVEDTHLVLPPKRSWLNMMSGRFSQHLLYWLAGSHTLKSVLLLLMMRSPSD